MADESSGKRDQERYGLPLVSVEAPLPNTKQGWKEAFRNLVESFLSVKALAGSSETEPVPEYPIRCFLVWARRCSQLVKLHEKELLADSVFRILPDGIQLPDDARKRLAKFGEDSAARLEEMSQYANVDRPAELRWLSDDWFRFQAKRIAMIVGKLTPELMFSDWASVESLLYAAGIEIAECDWLLDGQSNETRNKGKMSGWHKRKDWWAAFDKAGHGKDSWCKERVLDWVDSGVMEVDPKAPKGGMIQFQIAFLNQMSVKEPSQKG